MKQGERLGRYEILDLLGRGGMGEVYRARDTRLDRLVAIKILAHGLGADPDARGRFEREARAVAALSHPNILAVYDVGDAGGIPFVVTELLEGATLEMRLRAGALPASRAHDYALQLARGLAAAHGRGILHRDLKPANAFVTAGGQVKILDFGLAVINTAARDDSETRADVRTTPGDFLGTPAYMPPEQMRQQPLDHRADLFAFGAVLYEMLAGAPPFPGATLADIVAAVLTREPKALDPRDPLAGALERIARRCLAKRPEGRFGSAEELIEALAGAVSDSATTGATSGWSVPPPPAASIAVLPFVDLSAEQNLAYLCDGLAEEIIGGLARLEGLQVAARTSSFRFRGSGDDVREIGRVLGAGAVLEGSVRASGTRLRIATQLVNVVDGYQLWSERFDRSADDVFAIEDEIASAVVGALRGRLASTTASRAVIARGTDDVEAYTLYLKGRHLWNKRTDDHLRKAATLFQAAIDQDPVYGPAHAALAEVFVTLGIYGVARPADVMPKARAAARAALATAMPVTGTEATLATVAAIYDWDWAEAARLFERATAADPDHPGTHHWHAMNSLLPQRRFREAEQALEHARSLDPLSTIIGVSLGISAFFERRYDEAVKRLERTLELDEGFAMGHFFLGQIRTEMGDHARAIAALTRAAELSGESPEVAAALGHAQGRAGHGTEAAEALARLARTGERRYVSPVLRALVHTGLDEREAAIEALLEAERLRAADLVWCAVRPAFDRLRDDSRFIALCARVGVPAGQLA